MQAVRLHGVRDLRVEDIPDPAAPKPGEVLVHVTAAGICGSDLHNFATGAWITRTPSVAGHELTGIVAAVGQDADRPWIGRSVIVDSRVTCGTCRNCTAGLAQICLAMGFVGEVIDGGFAPQVVLPVRNLWPAPDGLAPRHLAMAEPLAVALHALNRAHLPRGVPLLITGCGSIGALVALLAGRRGHPLLLADRNAARAARLADICGGAVCTLPDLGAAPPRHAVDTTGAPAVIAALVHGLAGGGAIVLVGLGSGALSVDPAHLVEREIALIGSHAFADELGGIGTDLVALAPRLDALIEREIALSEVPAAYDRHLSGQATGLKTILYPAGAVP